MAKRDAIGHFELMVLLALMRLGENAHGVPIASTNVHEHFMPGGNRAAVDRLDDFTKQAVAAIA